LPFSRKTIVSRLVFYPRTHFILGGETTFDILMLLPVHDECIDCGDADQCNQEELKSAWYIAGPVCSDESTNAGYDQNRYEAQSAFGPVHDINLMLFISNLMLDIQHILSSRTSRSKLL